MNEPTVVSYIQRLHELFDRVVDLPPAEREAEIARAAADAPELANDLRALLEHADRTHSPLDDAAVRLPDESPLPQMPGFRVHRRIGRGGSATVYLADQEHTDFTRQVALKIVDRLLDDSHLRSVREEQRILARLEHPGIARLYDSGMTPWGQHWLAMEHVEGQSILEHCRSRKLTMGERVELFLSVLDAVAYAHARGIVHRDLKPANIFVTASGEPRLLDFGIAKLSDPADQDETRTLQRALTPAYASPEQVRGGRTTTATDIYSLGVVLYELLTGKLPDRDATEPLAASRGTDIDAVLHKALRHDPHERYSSVAAMADDLRRVLAGERVEARRGDRAYRARKLLRRHRVAIVIGIVVLLFAASLPFASRWRAARPTNEVAVFYDVKPVDSETRDWLRDGAERLARFDAMAARDSFRRAAESSKGRLPGEALAWDGIARAEGALGEVGRSGDAARRAGALIVGREDLLPRHEAERLRARALAANRDWNAAISAFESLFSVQPERVDVGLDLVRTLLACGRTEAADTALGRLRQIATGKEDPRVEVMEAEVALQLTELQRAAAAASRARELAARVHAVALGQRAGRVHADAMSRLDRREEARQLLTTIIPRNETLDLANETANARLELGVVLLQYAGADASRTHLEAARAGCVKTGDRRCEISARLLLAMIAGMDGRFKEAIPAVQAALADARAIGDRWSEGYVLAQLHVLYNWADDTVAVKAMEEPLLSALRDSGNRRLLLITLTNCSHVAVESLDVEKAEAYIVEAEALTRRVGSQLARASTYAARGYLEQTRGDLDLARRSYTAGLDLARRTGVRWNIGSYLEDLAALELAADRPGPAAEYAKEAIAVFTAVGDKQMSRGPESVLAWSEARQGNVAEARRRLDALRQVMAKDGSDEDRFTFLDVEAHVAAATGEWRRAIEIRRQMVRMATEWEAPGVVITQQVYLAKALHGAGDRRGMEKLVAEMLPEVERHGLRGVARELRALLRLSPRA